MVERALAGLGEEGGGEEVVVVGPTDLVPPGIPCVDVPGWDGSEASAGGVAAEAVERAAGMALRGEVAGIVTGPIHKPALREAGRHATGHTEMLRDLAGVPEVGMLMCAEATRLGPPLRVLLATTHIPLREVPDRLTVDLLSNQTRLLHDALRREWGIPDPRLALCALNPHASDRGLFGDEEERILAPAVARMREEGRDVEGPLPADTVFTLALDGRFDAVVAPYHDVGMAAFKTLAFGRGVNVTLGLPFVRTSPDHGTAFDLAGTGRADPSSMREALRLAFRLARRRAGAEGSRGETADQTGHLREL